MLKKDGTKSINSKQKGSSFELKIAKHISKVFDIEYGKFIRRTPGSGALLCRADLWIHEKYRARFNFFLECKKRQNIKFEQIHLLTSDLYKWYIEAVEKLQVDPDYDKNTPVMLVFSRNHWPVYALVGEKLDDSNAHTKFSFIVKLPKTKMYCYLFDEYILIYKELAELKNVC